MEEFALYLFKSVVWLAGFTLVFILFLKNERFFLLNRIYLIAGILSSFILPLISIRYTIVLPAVASYPIGNSVSSGSQIIQHSLFPEIKTVLFALYIGGVGIVVLLAGRQGRSVFRAIKKSEVISLQPVKLIKTPEYTSAFSFFSYVFVNPSVSDIEAREIMIHELVHIRQKHWFDLLLVELLRIMQWFNPLVWIYVRFIRQNHEYLADEAALQQTSDPAVYKAVLLNQIAGAPVISLTNPFNYSPNKKRFYMMKNIMNSPYRKMKVLFILPVFAILLYSFAKPDYKYKYTGQADTINATSDTIKHNNKGKVPPPPPPLPAVPEAPGQDAPTPPPQVNEIPAPPPPPQPAYIITSDGSVPLYIVDGVIVPADEANRIDMTLVESVSVLKSTSTTEKYGEKGKNGVVEITTKRNALSTPDAPLQTDLKIRGNADKTPLVIVDGVIKDISVNKIDPNSIESVMVLTDKTATDKYGEKAKDGAIEIALKVAPKVEIRSENGVEKPLVVVDGVVKDIEIDAIDPESIESITVLKDQNATARYGEKGKDGVIIIRLKNDISVNPVIRTNEKAEVINDVIVVKDVSVEKDVPVKK